MECENCALVEKHCMRAPACRCWGPSPRPAEMHRADCICRTVLAFFFQPLIALLPVWPVCSFFGSASSPYDVAGSTKAGEAYRLILRKSLGERRPWALVSAGASIAAEKDTVRYTLYAVNDDMVSSVNHNCMVCHSHITHMCHALATPAHHQKSTSCCLFTSTALPPCPHPTPHASTCLRARPPPCRPTTCTASMRSGSVTTSLLT